MGFIGKNISKMVGKSISRIAQKAKEQPTGPGFVGRKDNMAGMAVEAKKGGLMSKMKMVTKNGKKVPAFAADGVGKMKKGGMAGMHRMPDGKLMKDSEHDKMGRAVKRKTADVKGRAMKKGK